MVQDYYGKEVEVVSSATVKTAVSFVKEVDEKNNNAEVGWKIFLQLLFTCVGSLSQMYIIVGVQEGRGAHKASAKYTGICQYKPVPKNHGLFAKNFPFTSK